MNNKILVVLLLILGIGGVALAQNATAGKDLFTAKCAMCHGADASANTAMGKNLKIPDLRAPEVQKKSDVDLKEIITKGKGKMPAYESKLTAEQVSQAVDFIRQVGKLK